jgi:hypothetical protein
MVTPAGSKIQTIEATFDASSILNLKFRTNIQNSFRIDSKYSFSTFISSQMLKYSSSKCWITPRLMFLRAVNASH